jgi:hypothetical protein
MKYIVLGTSKEEFMFVFSGEIMHKNMADAVRRMKVGEIISAGFIMSGSRKCFGTSESLGVKSRSDVDTQLLADGGWRKLVTTT